MIRKQWQQRGVLSLLLALAVVPACLPGGSQRARNQPGDGSVLTSLEGISPEDQARKGLNFFLVCGDFRETGTRIENNGDPLIRFSAARIQKDSLCALEIRAPEDGSFNLDEYEWYGRKAGVEVKGLMYASNLATPRDGKLDVKIYVLYARQNPSSEFVAELRAQLELGDNETKPTTTEPPQLECDGDYRRPGTYQSQNGKDVLLTFKLNPTEAKDKVCNKLALRAVVDGKELQWEASVQISLGSPKAGDTLNLPATGSEPFLLKKLSTRLDNNSVDVSTDAGGPCLRYVQGEGCLDLTSQSLELAPAAQNYVWLKVEGLSASGARQSYIVGAGERGFNLLNSRAIARDEIQASLTAMGPRSWNWYRLGVYPDPRDLEFSANLISGESKKADAIDPAELKGFTVLNLAEIWLHGFYEVGSLADLNMRSSARWYVTLDIKKEGATVASLVVSDQAKYLTSDGAITTLANGSKALFDLDNFTQNRADAGQGWNIWTVAGSAGVDATCTMDLRYIANEYGRRHSGDFASMTPDTKLDACALTRERFNQLYGTGHTITLGKVMVWDWHRLDKVFQ